jgi:hypothetical protein
MSRRNLWIVAAACGLSLLGGYQLHVFAIGAPNPPGLFYSGMLEEDGAPANGTFTVTLKLYLAATGGEALCEATDQTEVQAGRFRIDASSCMNAVRDEADTWLEVSFVGSDGVSRTIADRTKIGAVPYALEADHAYSASNATGELDSALQALTARVAALEDETHASGFHAVANAAQTIPDGGGPVVFENERYDFGDEYDEGSGVFTTREGGYYEFTCILAWSVAQGVVNQWEVGLRVNGNERYYNGFVTQGQATTRMIHGIVHLEPDETVQCAGYQDSGADQSLDVRWDYTMFAGHRFAK